MCVYQRVIRRLFSHSENCWPLDGSFPIGAASNFIFANIDSNALRTSPLLLFLWPPIDVGFHLAQYSSCFLLVFLSMRETMASSNVSSPTAANNRPQ